MSDERDRDPRETGERVIDRLAAEGVEYVFATFGTDHPPLIKRLSAVDAPKTVLVPDETLAASMAHGYAQRTGDPQAVLVHVDVGTANLGPALHNAARSRIPLFVMAGRTPLTTHGELPGTRSIFVHYYQDVYDQGGLVREYTKWERDLATGANAERVVSRGLEVARADPPGPVYLTLPREVLRSTEESNSDGDAENGGNERDRLDDPDRERRPPTGSPDRATVTLGTRSLDELVSLLEDADYPVFVTSSLGRDESAVGVLEAFAETVGVGVVEAAPAFDLSLARDHPLHLGFSAETHLEEADLLLTAACDVPWVPSQATPREDAIVVAIDPDPEKLQYPLPGVEPDRTVRADPKAVLADLTEAYRTAGVDAHERVDRLQEVGATRREARERAVPTIEDAEAITPELLSRTVGDLLDPEDIVLDETVTNTVSVLGHCRRTVPGSYYSYCSSGLGWAAGAALGVALADPPGRVVSLVGDGSYLLGNPLAAIQVAQAYDCPHLTVVYDNRGWQAVGDAVRDQYGDAGFGYEAFTTFDPPADLAGAAAGAGCHGERVANPAALEGALRRGLEAVDRGTTAVVTVALE